MEIRPADKKDIPGLLRLLGQVGQVHHQIRPDIFPEGTLKYNAQALAQLLEDKTRPVFAAVEGDALLGYCFCVHRDYEKTPVSVERRELYIDDLCVEETCRGQGVAGALYRFVTDYAKKQGCSHITLNVWCGNEPALRFYEKAGLRPRAITMETSLEDRKC